MFFLFTPLRQCGVLNVGVNNGKFLTSIASAMSRHGMEYEVIQPNQLGQRYPMLSYPLSRGALLDPKGGILRADKALAAFQVWGSSSSDNIQLRMPDQTSGGNN